MLSSQLLVGQLASLLTSNIQKNSKLYKKKKNLLTMRDIIC